MLGKTDKKERDKVQNVLQNYILGPPEEEKKLGSEIISHGRKFLILTSPIYARNFCSFSLLPLRFLNFSTSCPH